MEKVQNVTAYITNIKKGMMVLKYAAAIARIFKNPLAVLYIIDKKYEAVNENKINSAFNDFKQQPFIADLEISFHLKKGNTKQILETGEILSDTICLVASVDKDAKKTAEYPAEVLKNCKNLRMAYLLLQENTIQEPKFENVGLSIDFEKEEKEKITWASFFGRFCDSYISVLYYLYKDEYLAHRVNNNIRFLKKIFENVKISTFSISEIEKISRSPDIAAINYAKRNNIDLLIALRTKNKDLQDFISGTAESKIVVNDYKIPILLINPRDDLYVICN